MNNVVTACGNQTAVEASIHLDTIPIITGFKTLRFGFKVVAYNTIAASRHTARARAGVGVDSVAIIADLTVINSAVAAVL